jgi:hypothetical protein
MKVLARAENFAVAAWADFGIRMGAPPVRGVRACSPSLSRRLMVADRWWLSSSTVQLFRSVSWMSFCRSMASSTSTIRRRWLQLSGSPFSLWRALRASRAFSLG